MNGASILKSSLRLHDVVPSEDASEGEDLDGSETCGVYHADVSEAADIDEQTYELGEHSVVVADPQMKDVYRRLERLAATHLSVLLLGETGTGKELAATAIHTWSKRASQPFVAINCAALPDTLAESELFGYERGAFSGAARAKPGLLESARGGTVFLDEIGDLSLAVQAKLLRVLETRRVARLGSVHECPVDFRLISATGRPLDKGIKAGWFREDLYYRLSAAVVRLSPLRERRRELRLLVRRFLDESRSAAGLPPVSISDAAMTRLLAHDWPGNIRELKNLMEYLAATVTSEQIGPEQIADQLANGTVAETPAPWTPVEAPVPLQPLADASREFERKNLEAALAATGGNRTRAARLLKIPLRTLMDKIKRHGICGRAAHGLEVESEKDTGHSC